MTDWLTVLIASLISATSAIAAVFLKEIWDTRARRIERRQRAYLSLAAASEVIAMRSAVFNSQRTFKSSIASALGDAKKFLLILVLSWFWSAKNAEGSTLDRLAASLATPTSVDQVMKPSELIAAMDKLIIARVEVGLFGSGAAIDAANELLAKSKEYLTAVERSSGNWLQGIRSTNSAGENERIAMIDAHDNFLQVVRSER